MEPAHLGVIFDSSIVIEAGRQYLDVALPLIGDNGYGMLPPWDATTSLRHYGHTRPS